jgi:hypothetical protein
MSISVSVTRFLTHLLIILQVFSMTGKKNLVRAFFMLLTLFVISMNVVKAKTGSTYTVRVAILDNFTAEKSSQKYKDAYIRGVIAAKLAASEKGFSIQYKTFTYGSNPLDILVSVSELQSWKPDLIIGPHSSNQFLLMPKYFKDIMVVSPYATDEATTKMPANFYSLSWPDSYMVKATLAFMEKYYPGRDVFNLTQADCKDCFDMTEIFSKMYKTKYPNAQVINSYYTGNSVLNLNLLKIMSRYKRDSVIVLQPLSYADATILISSISNHLKQRNSIFIHNLDNWGNLTEAKKIISDDGIGYSSFRVCPQMENPKSENYKKYLSYYQRTFHSDPDNAVSYMTYSSVVSAIDALAYLPHEKLRNIREAIIFAYQAALKKNRNWYRSESFVYYQLEAEGEKKKEVIFQI